MRTCAVFPESGDAWPAHFPEFLWERALFTAGDYLLPKGRNSSLLDDRDRDASWRRLLRADTRLHDREARRDVVRRVLAQIDPQDAVGSLRAIVAAGVQGVDLLPVPGIRRRLVTQPRLLAYCQKRMLRLEDDSAFLLARSQRNGYHVDLYVYDLFLRLDSRQSGIAPLSELKLIDQTDTYANSLVRLRASAVGLTLSAEKHGSKMMLKIQQIPLDPDLAPRLKSWAANGSNGLVRSLQPDEAEDAILAVSVALRSVSPANDTEATVI